VKNLNNQILVTSLPIKLSKLIEKLNIEFLKRNFHSQSEFKIQKYNLDINSRELIFKDKKIKLTEKESNIILYISNSIKPVSIEDLQLNVWGYHSDLETHTVETHVYRLRKKILATFDDNDFINSEKNGYQIN
jgi:DNA-binding response OmpR family regulator